MGTAWTCERRAQFVVDLSRWWPKTPFISFHVRKVLNHMPPTTTMFRTVTRQIRNIYPVLFHRLQRRGYILGGRGRSWEGRTCEFVERGGGYILGGRGRFWEPKTLHIITIKGGGGGRFWEGGGRSREPLLSTPGV